MFGLNAFLAVLTLIALNISLRFAKVNKHFKQSSEHSRPNKVVEKIKTKLWPKAKYQLRNISEQFENYNAERAAEMQPWTGSLQH